MRLFLFHPHTLAGGEKDMIIHGLEEFDVRQTYRSWERAEQTMHRPKDF